MGISIKIGDTALQVSQEIVKRHKQIAKIRLYSWVWGTEYSLRYKTEQEKRKNREYALVTKGYTEEKDYPREKFLALKQDDLIISQPNQAWCICSKVVCKDGTIMHIPMMDADPEKVSLEEVIEALKILPERPAVLVKSGRGIHYYGDYLLSEAGWPRFLANFLLLDELNTSRYVGHCLHRGFCTLRLTGGAEGKKEVPKAVEILKP